MQYDGETYIFTHREGVRKREREREGKSLLTPDFLVADHIDSTQVGNTSYLLNILMEGISLQCGKTKRRRK